MTTPPPVDRGLEPPTQLDVEFVYVGDMSAAGVGGSHMPSKSSRLLRHAIFDLAYQ